MQNLDANPVALVTGAARRIGADICRLLHRQGMNILLHYNLSQSEAANLSRELNALRPRSAVIKAVDLQDISQFSALIDVALQTWGRLDVLVNNASRFYKTPLEEVTEFAWQDLFASNVKAPFFLAQIAVPALKKTNGTIINIADIHGIKPLKNYSVYTLTKSALIMLTKALALELGPQIRVNAVAPGPILWPEGNNALTVQQKQSIIDHTALLRSGEGNDIAKAVLFFIKDAPYVTGQVLSIDGGRLLY